MNIEKLINRLKYDARKAAYSGKNERALKLVSAVASYYYKTNCVRYDKELEDTIASIKIAETSNLGLDSKMVLFYDGFGLDYRGLAYIYLDAIAKLDYRIVYVVDRKKIGSVPRITDIIRSSNGVVCPVTGDFFARANQVLKIAYEYNVSKAFLYTTPSDSAGVLAFHNMSTVERYMIDLTDHAFWLGARCCDIYIEFRDYGSYVAEAERGIKQDLQAILPYYPKSGYTGGFLGFPFKVSDESFVIFSGGALYKTNDKEGIFFGAVKRILDTYKNTVFWYAGGGKSDRLNALIKEYPGRVFHTEEREDLEQVLENVDLYLSTFPLAGGLMMQYAAKAGCFPLTLRMGPNKYELDGILIDNKRIRMFSYSVNELLGEFNRIYNDKEYRQYLQQEIKKCIISEEVFVDNLKLIMENGKSSFRYSEKKFNTANLYAFYGKNNYDALFDAISLKTHSLLFRYIPFRYVDHLVKYILSRYVFNRL